MQPFYLQSDTTQCQTLLPPLDGVVQTSCHSQIQMLCDGNSFDFGWKCNF